MPLSPSLSNILIAGISEWAVKAQGDTGYAVLPFLRHGVASIEPLFEDNAKGEAIPYAYEVHLVAEILGINSLLSKNPSLLVSLASLVIDHRVTLIGGGVISSSPLISTPSPTGFGVKWRFCSDKDASDACYLEISASRRITPAEYTQILTSVNADSTPAISSDTFYSLGTATRSDIMPTGVLQAEFGSSSLLGDTVSNLRLAKLEMELLTTKDQRGQFIGSGIQISFDFEALETAEVENLKWVGIVTRINYVKATMLGGLVLNFSTTLGVKFSYISDSDMESIARGGVSCQGLISLSQISSILKGTDVGVLICFGGISLAAGATRYCQFDDPTLTTGATDFKLFLGKGTLKNLIVTGGGGNSTTFNCAIFKNGSTSALAVTGVTTPGAGNWGSPVADTTDQISFNGTSDYVCIQLVNTGGNVLNTVSIYAEFVPG